MASILRILVCLLFFTSIFHPIAESWEADTQTTSDYGAQRLENAFGGHFLRIKKQTSSHKATEILGVEESKHELFDSLTKHFPCTILLFMRVPQLHWNTDQHVERHIPKTFSALFIALHNLRI